MKKKLYYNVTSQMARLIGRQNISNLESAIVELVKNTYDADAKDCIIYYSESKNVLYIVDNGTGMTEDIIKSHWMTIGNSSKSKEYISPKGRTQTGEKGIGRFALDRMSDQCQMLTINSQNGIIWSENWNNFDKEGNITDAFAEIEYTNMKFLDFFREVKNEFVKEKISKDFKGTGTAFKLTSLRENEWDAEKVANVKNNLSSLIPPGIENKFSLYVFEDNTNIEDALVVPQNIDTYDYKIKFEVRNDGNVIVNIDRNEFDFKDEFEEIIQKAKFKEEDKKYFNNKEIIENTSLKELINLTQQDGENPIGEFSGTLYFYKLQAAKTDKEKFYYKDTTGRKNMMRNFGGIKLYRDDFRVKPYGEYNTSDYDWLLLANRNRKSPAAISHKTGKWTVNAEQMLGTILISRKSTKLEDQANREGIIDTREFELFKKAIIAIISLFEKDRQYVGRKLIDYYNEKNEFERKKQEILKQAEELRKLKKSANSSKEENTEVQVMGNNETINNAAQVIEHLEGNLADLSKEKETLMALATIGISTNTYVHEIEESHHSLERKIALVENEVENNGSKEEILESIKAMKNTVEKMNSWFVVTLYSISKRKRDFKENNINNIIQEQIKMWNKIHNTIIINFESDEIITFNCIECEIISIISNLIANSIVSFENGNNKSNEINIRLTKLDNIIKFEYWDNGNGLISMYKKDPYKILEANETSRISRNGQRDGTGMGMWIINNIVDKYKGKIDLSKNKNHEKGFYIDILLS